MNLKKNWKVLTSKSVGTGHSSYEKRIYGAAVSQRLRNTGVDAQKRQNACPFQHHRHVVFLKTSQCQRLLGTVQSSASTFGIQYRLVSLLSFTSCLYLLPRLPFLSIFPSIACIRRKFQRKM